MKTINVTDKTGSLISIRNVSDGDDLMIINKSGILIRISMSDIRVMGRATQGVRLINIKPGDSIAAVAKVEKDMVEDENSDELIDENGDQVENSTEGNTDQSDDVKGESDENTDDQGEESSEE